MRVFFIILAIISVMIWSAFIVFLLRARRARNWPTAPGEIIRRPGLRQEEDDDGRHYRVFVKYRYEVDGVTYESDRVRIVEIQTGFQAHAQRLLAEARAQVTDEDRVSVYYNPANPCEAVLLPGTPRYVVVFAMTLSALVVALMLWGALLASSGE